MAKKKSAKIIALSENIVERIVMRPNANGAWYWTLKGRNGETLAHSEAYSSRAKCLKTAREVFIQLNCVLDCFADAV